MNKNLIIEKTKEFVKCKLYGEGSGHDWWHIERVYNMSKFLASDQITDNFIIEMTALLHDIDDWKFSKENKATTYATEEFLNSVNVERGDIIKIISIIKTMSFKGGVVDSNQITLEGMIVQDADRLDAMGAIGVARAFAYGGNKNRQIYDPNLKPIEFNSLDEVKNIENHTINHFYEKLLKLKDSMNTEAAREIATRRQDFMNQFLDEFYYEWNFK